MLSKRKESESRPVMEMSRTELRNTIMEAMLIVTIILAVIVPLGLFWVIATILAQVAG